MCMPVHACVSDRYVHMCMWLQVHTCVWEPEAGIRFSISSPLPPPLSSEQVVSSGAHQFSKTAGPASSRSPFYLISVLMPELGSELPVSHFHGKCCTSWLISHPLLLSYDCRKSKGKEAKPDKAKKFSHLVRFRAGERISCGKINSLHCSSDLYLFLITRISSKKFLFFLLHLWFCWC